jgi:anti-sigma B factor antagonist
MSKDIKVSISQLNDIIVIDIEGDITAVTGEVVQEAYMTDSIAEDTSILLRFAKDCYINSGGLAFLIDIASEGRKKGQKIAATGLSDHFQKIFHMVGLTRCISVFASEEEAMKDF